MYDEGCFESIECFKRDFLAIENLKVARFILPLPGIFEKRKKGFGVYFRAKRGGLPQFLEENMGQVLGERF